MAEEPLAPTPKTVVSGPIAGILSYVLLKVFGLDSPELIAGVMMVLQWVSVYFFGFKFK